MKTMPLLVIVCTCLLLNAVTNTEAGRLQACGSALANLLRSVCGGRYNEPTGTRIGKRDTKEIAQISDNKKVGHVDAYDYLLRNDRSVGVAAECCRNACTYSTLQSYCMPDDD